MKKIGVICAGSWGTALALLPARNNHEVLIWSHRLDIVDSINKHHINSAHLSNYVLPKSIRATNNLLDLVECELLVLVAPAQKIREIISKLPHDREFSIIICSKGIEISSLKLLSEVVEEILPMSKIAILSGPNFAEEVAKDLPAIATVACKDIELTTDIINIFANLNFRIYPSQDLIGTQICAAAKNVIAIASGICMGKNLGENTQAAILTRGLHEINKLIIAKGGDSETLMSPAGIGDLALTCRSLTSRNMRFGYELATEYTLKSAALIEGSFTAKSINALANKLQVEMPIAKAVEEIIDHPHQLDTIIAKLLERSRPILL